MLLAIDQGGHGSRAVVFDRAGSVVASSHVPLAVHATEARVEHDPEELMTSIRVAIDDVLADASLRKTVTSVGLATQRSSLLAWNAGTGRAVSPVLSWQDRRAASWLEEFSAESHRVRDRTGLFLSPHYGASKYRWLLDHEQEVQDARAQGVLVMGPLSTFVAFRLCKERPFLVDPSNASRTLLWNRSTLDWDPELLDLFGVPRELLPECTETAREHGHIETHDACLPLALVTGDQAAALYGAGEPRADILYANVGTGAFLMRIADAVPGVHDRLLESVVRTEGGVATRVLEATVNGAGSAVTWFEEGEGPCIDELAAWLEDVDTSLLFVNGVSGLASPWWRPGLESRFVGAGSRAERAVAVVESIVFLMKRNVEVLSEELPKLRCIRVSGGLSRWDGFVRRLANLTGLPVERTDIHEATARGAAWLLTDGATWDAGDMGRFEASPDAGLVKRYEAWLREMPEV